MKTLTRTSIYWLVSLVVLCSGCAPNQGAQTLLDVIAEQEIFKAGFIVLQRPGGNQSRYTLQLDYGVGGCRPFSLNETELIALLNTRQIPGVANVPFRFGMLASCMNTGSIDFASNQLSVRTFDNNGNPVGIDRPRNVALVKQVDASFTRGGVMNASVFGISLIATTASGTRAVDRLNFSVAQVPATSVGRSGNGFAYDQVSSRYIRGEIGAVATNPSRFTLEFAFAAKQQSAADTLLLVWSDDIVLRTDI